MKHSDFVIGKTFRCGDGLWRVTDIGTRVAVAIRIDRLEISTITNQCLRFMSREEAEPDGWFDGPPYTVEETVFDEDDQKVCSLE